MMFILLQFRSRLIEDNEGMATGRIGN